MNGALFRKELRSLRPFLFVVLALLLMDVVDAFLVPFSTRAFPDRLQTLSTELAILQIVLGFALGANLLVREIDDGTLDFLDGLPLRRRTIFAAKVQAALLVLLIFPAGTLLLNAALHAATRGSLDQALRPSLLLTMFALSCLVTTVALAAGMLLGFLRHVAWLVLVLCAVGIQLLQYTAPAAAILDTSDLLTLRFTGTAWQLPMATIWTQLGAAMLFAALAFALFCSAGKVRARVQRSGALRRWSARIGIALMAAAALAGISLLVERSKAGRDGNAGSDRADALEFAPIAGAHATTRHYSFSYPALSSARVRPLIDEADRTFGAVAALLGIKGGAPIDVDLSGTIENHAGTAYLDRIRMRVNDESDENARSVLAHETAHVFAMRLAGGARGRQLEEMLVLNEGVAAWVENKLDGQAGVTQEQELAAAIVSARRLVTPRQLTDQIAFIGAVDENLKYPLGAILVDRLVQRYGPAAPATLLRALAREDFPRDLEGYVLWQTAFQLARFDLDLVLDDYARHLKRLESTHARHIAQLPRPRGSLVDEDDAFAIALRFDLPVPEGATPLVRYRPGKAGTAANYRVRYGQLSDAGTYSVEVPENIITRGEVCFQPGLIVDSLVMYEPWVCLPVDAAEGD